MNNMIIKLQKERFCINLSLPSRQTGRKQIFSKRSYLLLLGILLHFGAFSQGDISVEINNIPNNEGQIIVSLHSVKENFPKKYSYRKLVKISNRKAITTFHNIPHGDYAISIIHDENKNGKLDFYIFGMPSEKTAASNNAKAFLGPPSWEDAKFTLDKKQIQQYIRM